MTPSGIVSLTTDFGTQDPYVGILKGVLLAHFGDLRIIDFCHEVPPGNTGIAGMWLGRSHGWFPAGTVHLAVVDPGVGTERDVVCLETADHVFLAPDNGLPDQILKAFDHAEARVVEIDRLTGLGGRAVSQTFHGRDIMAPIAAWLAGDRLKFADLGPVTDSLVPSPLPCPRVSENVVEGQVIAIDRFGNLITNIDAGDAGRPEDAEIVFAGRRLGFVATYGKAPPGQPIGLINSFDLVEIAIDQGNAAAFLASGVGAPVTVRPAGRTP